MKGRFAPSPTGRMHLGNIWAALLNWLYIRAQDGELILRIEDIDRGRCRDEYAMQLLRDMEALGFDWDGDIVYQSARTSLHFDVLEQWQKQGYCYPCYCTRADLHSGSAPHIEDGRFIYSGACRSLTEPSEGSFSLRLILPEREMRYLDMHYGLQVASLARDFGDIVIWRKDNTPSYQFACALDDALMDVDMIIRGNDLLGSAFPQMYITELAGKSIPSHLHVPLLLGSDGHRLSKRHAAFDLGNMLGSGKAPADILGYLGYLANILPENAPATAQELLCIVRQKGLPRLPKQNIRVDRSFC